MMDRAKSGWPEAVVFDFDGVLVDSERVHCATLSAVVEGLGLKGVGWEEYCRELMGFDDRDAFRAALAARGREPEAGLVERCIAEKARLFAEAAEAGAVPELPGAAAFVKECAARGKVGLCSGALRSDTGPVLRRMGLEGVFSAVVTAEDVERSKPDPESYRLCAERLGVEARRCVAFEDTADGVRSARGAGFRVVGVMTTLGEEELRTAGAEWVVRGLGEAGGGIFGHTEAQRDRGTEGGKKLAQKDTKKTKGKGEGGGEKLTRRRGDAEGEKRFSTKGQKGEKEGEGKLAGRGRRASGGKKKPHDGAKWKLVTTYGVETYRCGAKAGDLVRLKKDLVIRHWDGRPTGEVLRAGEVWKVLSGSAEDPGVVWLLQPDGERHTWDDDECLWEWFERVGEEGR